MILKQSPTVVPITRKKQRALEDEALRIKRALARQEFLPFCCYTMPEYYVNWHHRVTAYYLDLWVKKKIRFLILSEPPRHGKSEQVSRRLPAYILGQNPDAKIIAASYGAELSQLMNRDIQRIIDSELYRDLFPDTELFESNIRTVAQGSYLRNSDIFEIVGHKGVYKNAGVGGPLTGMGADYAIIDDPVKDRKDAESPTIRKTTWEWYKSTLRTRLEKGGSVLLTMTRWQEEDLAGMCIEQAKKSLKADQWHVVNLPAIAEGELDPRDPRKPGEALWPWKFPIEELIQMKATSSSYEFGGMYQGSPSPSEGGIFKRDWWRYYKITPSVFDAVIMSVDCAFKDLDDSSYVVVQVWGRIGANCYLLDQIRDHLNLTGTKEAVRQMHFKWQQAGLKLIEDKANGTAVIHLLMNEIPGLVPVEPEGGKVARARVIEYLCEARNVWLPDPELCPWVKDFVEEAAAFPNAANDDQVDGMTQALTRLPHLGLTDEPPDEVDTEDLIEEEVNLGDY